MKVAVVGLGMMGNLHLRVLRGHPMVSSVVGVEADEARGRAVSEEFGIDVLSPKDDWSAAVDATFICLPDDLHVDITINELQAGKYVFVEKPLATTVAGCEAILAAQPESGRLMVGHLLRFDERLRELKRQINSGLFGKIHYIRIHRANTASTAQRVGQRASVAAFLGVHDLDLLLWLTGQKIESVQARGQRVTGPHWDVVAANLVLEGGIFAVVENHWLIHEASSRNCLAGVEVFAEHGTALVNLSTEELELITDGEARSRHVDTRNWTHDANISGGSLRREVESFLAAAAAGKPVEVSGEDGYRAVHAVELVEAALSTSDPVTPR